MTESWELRPPERVSALGRSAITEMLDALPARDLAHCLRQFAPKQKGFRPGHSPPALTKSKLASVLTSHVPKDSSPEWHAYAHAWSDFTEARFGTAWLDAHTILDGNGEVRPELVEQLELAVTSKKFSRDELLQALRLAPTTIDARALELAATAPSQSEIDALRRADDIEDMKNELMLLGAALSKMTGRIEAVEQLEPISKRKLDERLSAATQGLAKDLAVLKRDLSTLDSRLKTFETAVPAAQSRLAELERAVPDLAKRIGTAAAEAATIQKALPRIEALEIANDQSGEIQKALPRIVALERATEEAEIAKLPQLSTAVSEVETLAIDLLERVVRLEASGGQVAGAPSTPPHQIQALQCEWLQRAVENQPVTTVQALGTTIEGALDLIGIREESAALVSRELAAAIACGQWSILRGSCATEVAEVIGAAIDPKPLQIITSATSLTPLALARSAEQRAVVIEGVNRIALEVVARDMRVATIRQQLGLTRSLDVVLAVCTDGATSLPIGMELLELGPIIDVDALDWRNTSVNRSLRTASLALSRIETAAMSLHDFDDQELKPVIGHQTRVWRLGVARWLGALHQLKVKPAELRTALVCDWVLPLTALTNPDSLRTLTYTDRSREARVVSDLLGLAQR